MLSQCRGGHHERRPSFFTNRSEYGKGTTTSNRR
jgi:hypothetical protein